jgi:hypothetical protein
VDNGAFQYPDLPLPARDIYVDLSIANPGGDADSTVVRLERFRAPNTTAASGASTRTRGEDRPPVDRHVRLLISS